jgi:hypothetical protein
MMMMITRQSKDRRWSMNRRKTNGSTGTKGRRSN